MCAANVGVNIPKSYPNYLDASSYMFMYNEACRNDGIAERYDASTIYNTAMGNNPYRYPVYTFIVQIICGSSILIQMLQAKFMEVMKGLVIT